MNERLVALVLGAAAFGWSAARWRQGVRAGLVLLIIEGALRKWVLPGAQDLVYFAKDVVFLGAYLGYLRSGVATRIRVPVSRALTLLLAGSAVFGLLQVANPNLPNVLVGLLGFRAYFIYVPLLFVLPRAFRDIGELARFLRLWALLAVPIGLLAAAQFFSPGSSLLNVYARGGSGAITGFGTSSHIRVTGTFSYITGFTAYLLANAVLILALLTAVRWQFRRSWLLLAALGMTILGMLMSGSRGPVLMFALLMPLYWWLAVAREKAGGLIAGRALAAMGLLGVLIGYTGEEALSAFRGRAAGATDVVGRMLAPLIGPIHHFEDAGLLGAGIGATHQTATAVTKGIVPYSWLPRTSAEVESGRVMIELGGLGFVLTYASRIYLLIYGLSQVTKIRTAFCRSLATGSVLFFLASIPGAVVFDFVSGVYYWFFAGLLFLSMRLDREVQARLAAERQRAAPGLAVAAA